MNDELPLLTILGVVVEGHRVAAAASRDYPYGTLQKQFPFFMRKGLNLEDFFAGTLNISIAPLLFDLYEPQLTFRQVHWTDLHPPEDFSFSSCRILYRGAMHEGYVYYPHPETKARHFQNPSVLEIITFPILGIHYGDRVELLLDPGQVRIIQPG